jgi:basic membrane protein A
LHKRQSAFIGLILALTLIFAACGGSKDDTNNNPPSGDSSSDGGAATSDIRVGVAYDIGGLGDQSFNDAANRGLEAAIEEGIVAEENTDFLEPNASGSNRDDNVVNLADQGFDLIIAVGFAFSPGIDKIAADYPDTDFAVIDGFAGDAPNVTNLGFKEQEGSYLVGAAAASKSEAGTIGFLGGQSGTGLIEKFEAGYEAGACAVNPDIKILREYIGDSTAAFNDPTKGEALSSAMYDDGADVIYHASGASGAGLFKAAVEADKLAIGVDSDQSLTASPEQQAVILTSMLKRVDTAVHDAIQQEAEDSFQTGFQVFGMAEGGVDYAINEFNDNDDLLSADIQSTLDDYKQQIIDGEITVPEEPKGSC